MLSPVSMQVTDPVAQLVIPLWHLFAGVQDSPARQTRQAPPLQTLFVPQEVPFAAF